MTNGDRRDTDWITRDMGRIFPREWERHRGGEIGPAVRAATDRFARGRGE
ncbi:hypothetical protein JOF53_007952 [Crossiella equi]|uniref:Uncharacterized protein n=1 Tax=Crossiella equi TaxID=130796 RepID=A0ABS5ATR6_9PSEU|nr:hypothetical protein [Crossiella equi]MBP2479080.1 hypothetical protein [Crossiella equi]